MNYTTVWQHGQDEHIEKKSRFIGQAWPVHSEEEAREIIERTKKEFWDASHNVFTYRVGDIQRFTDDGEPSGTAGKPMLDVLLGRDLQNVLVIVTRYFGGTLLGTGGLVRAYTKGAQIAVEAAGIIDKAVFYRVSPPILTKINDIICKKYQINVIEAVVYDKTRKTNDKIKYLVSK